MLPLTTRPARALAAVVSAVAVASAAVAVLPAAPAAAASVRVEDPIQQVPGPVDLTSMTVTNGPRAVSVRLGVLELEPDQASVLAVVAPARGPGRTYVVGSVLRGDAPVVGLFRPSGDGLERVRCRGVRARLVQSDEEVRVRVPRPCLRGLPDRIAVAGLTESPSGADQDQTRTVRLRRG